MFKKTNNFFGIDSKTLSIPSIPKKNYIGLRDNVYSGSLIHQLLYAKSEIMRSIIFSYGGAVQSVAILVLIAQGKLQKPDVIIMADTGREGSATWDYLEEIAKPIMMSAGLCFDIAPHTLATVDLYGHNGDMLLPAYTQTGKLPTFCSDEWKQRPVRRRLRELGYGPKRPIIQWLGMSLDEVGRLRQSDVKWIDNHYPLCFDVKKRRHECELLIKEFGLPVPPKSACWMCPNRRNEEWQFLREHYPDDFQKAVALEQELSDADDSGLFFHKQRVELKNVDFSMTEQPQREFCANQCFT